MKFVLGILVLFLVVGLFARRYSRATALLLLSMIIAMTLYVYFV